MAGTEAEMEAVFAVCAARADVDSSLLNMEWSGVVCGSTVLYCIQCTNLGYIYKLVGSW